MAISKIDPHWLDLLNSKYAQYGPITDFEPTGSIGDNKISWQLAKKIVLDRDKYTCRICGKSEFKEIYDLYGHLKLDVEVHHIIPRKLGGSNSPKNLITLCRQCHISTFKNDYGGIPFISETNEATFFTDIAKIYGKIEVKYKFELEEIIMGNLEYKLESGLEGYLCHVNNFDEIKEMIMDYDPDIIVLKNPQNNKFIKGYINP